MNPNDIILGFSLKSKIFQKIYIKKIEFNCHPFYCIFGQQLPGFFEKMVINYGPKLMKNFEIVGILLMF